MSWLFVARLRPFVLLAGAASLLLNLALLMPSIYMTQVFDRVFSSRSVETLIMLSALALPAPRASSIAPERAMPSTAPRVDWLSPGLAPMMTSALKRGGVIPSPRVAR